MKRKTLLLTAVGFEGGLFLLALALTRISQLDVWDKFSVSLLATVYALLFCIPLFGVLLISMSSNWGPFARLRLELEGNVQPLFMNSSVFDFAIIAFLAGAGEELFFRGWMQSALITKSGVWVGILLTSLIFGLAHYISKDYAVYAFITGIYLGVIYYTYENLYVVMAIHAIYDFVALVYLVRKRKAESSEIPASE